MLKIHRRQTDGLLVAKGTADVSFHHFSQSTVKAHSSRQLGQGQELPEVLQWTEEVTIEELVGKGGFGYVYRASIRGREVAVKQLRRPCGNATAQFLSYLAELRAINLVHPHVVRIIEATPLSEFSERAWLLMEWGGHRDLQSLLNDVRESLPIERRLRFALQIASGVHFAHTRGLLHLDVKPANILVDKGDYCRLTDFGCCQSLHSSPLAESSNPRLRLAMQGTYAYRAPELLRGNSPGVTSDVYSVGVTLWQLLTRDLPFHNQNQHQVIFRVVAFDLRPDDPDLPEDDPLELLYRDLYTQCWRRDPDDRPSSSDLLDILRDWNLHVH